MWDAVTKSHPRILAYSHSAGIPELRRAFSAYYAGHQVELTPDELVVTAGGSEAILFALASTTDPGDEILVPEPLYANYIGFANMVGVNVVPIPTEPANGYHLPPRPVWEERLSSRTRAILYCSPGNPTGTVFTDEEVEMVLQMARDWGLWVVADEVYREFCYDGLKHRSVMTRKDDWDRIILVDSISKRFAACGARIGCLGSKNRRFLDTAMHYAQARLSPPGVGQIMATAALGLGQDYYRGIVTEFQRRRDVVMEEIARMPGVLCEKPRGAFYAAATLPVADAEDFAVWMLNEFQHEGETAFVAPGNGFYATPGAGRQEVRIAYVYQEDPLRRALRALAEGLKRYPGRKAEAGAAAARVTAKARD